MWKSSYCIFLSLILAIIGLSVDLLMWQQNVNNERVDIQAVWGYDGVEVSALIGDLEDYSHVINYNNAYNNYCQDVNSQPDSYCDDLNKIAKAGQAYMSFGLFGVLLLAISFILSVLLSFGKNCCCCCQCRLRLVIGVLVLMASICLIISFATFVNCFSNNVDNLLNKFIIDAKILQLVSWEEAKIGSSISLIISAMCFSFLSLSMILFIDRKYDNNNESNNNSRTQPNEPLIITQQPQPPVSSGIIYYQPNTDVNHSTNSHYGEADYVHTPNYQTQGQ